MRKVLILTEVFQPESFIINELVQDLSKNYQVIVLTRTPTYPRGKLYSGFSNSFSRSRENDIIVYRYPVFLNYNKYVVSKVANLLWQPIVYGFLIHLISWNTLFVYQTGSLYSYSLLWPLRLSKRKSIIWSQDLWPEAGFEFGLPRIRILEFLLALVTKHTLKHFDKVLVQSDWFKAHYQNKYHIGSDVVFNFSKTRKLRTYLARDDKHTMIYAGNIGSVQNLEGIIGLFHILKKSPIPIERLEVYGEGSKFLMLKNLYENDKDISFYGRVTSDIIEKELKICRYAVFSLVDGPVQMTIPSRLQFLYNNNVPVVYLGKGAAANIIKKTNCGVVIDSITMDKDMIAKRFLDFESRNFLTPDIFNQDTIIKEIIEYID